jgi:inner membrane protein
MQNTSNFKSKSTQLTLKVLLIAALTLSLLIPQFFISNLINERINYQRTVTEEVENSWAEKQVIAGPILAIPYNEMEWVSGVKKSIQKWVTVMPSELNLNTEIDTSEKYKSIYKVLLYKSENKITGNFTLPKANDIKIPIENLKYSEAKVIINVEDLRGIEGNITASFNGQSAQWKQDDIPIKCSYIDNDNTVNATVTYDSNTDQAVAKKYLGAIVSPIVITPLVTTIKFDMTIDVKGSETIEFIALADNQSHVIKSTFKDPIFVGRYLPDHKITSGGFDAAWKISKYNKNIPTYMDNVSNLDFMSSQYGVAIRHFQNHYTTIYRSSKYMMMIVILTFLVFLITELIKNIKVHVFQYLLVGLAIAIFYTLLLSLSESIGFVSAYMMAAVATIGLIYMYSLSVFRNRKSSLTLFLLLVLQFAFIFVILKLEQASLLVGSVGLFLVLAATMYATRNIKWYESEGTPDVTTNLE